MLRQLRLQGQVQRQVLQGHGGLHAQRRGGDAERDQRRQQRGRQAFGGGGGEEGVCVFYVCVCVLCLCVCVFLGKGAAGPGTPAGQVPHQDAKARPAVVGRQSSTSLGF